MEQEAPFLKKYVNMKFQKVKVNESFIPTLEDEAIEVEHLLAEPKNDHVSVDGVFHFDENLEKCLEMEDNPCRFECGLKTNSGGLDSNTTQEGDDNLKFGVFNGMMPEVDEVGNLHSTNGLSTACEDYLLDVEFAEKVPDLDYIPRGGSSLETSSESHSPGFSGSDNTAVGISESSTASIPVPECQNDIPDKKTTCEFHGALRSKCGCQARVKGKMQLNGPTSLEVPNLDKLENASNLVASGMFSNDNEKDIISNHGLTPGRTSFTSTNVQYNEASPVRQGVKRKRFGRRDVLTKSSVEASKVGTLTQKRLRKPTKRYIEEVSDLSSKCIKGKRKSSTTPSKDKLLGVRSRNEHHQMGFRRLKSVPREEPFGGASIQAPFGLRVRGGVSKNHASLSRLDSDEESSPEESEDDSETTIRSEKGVDRRKHQRLWTLSEVIKLVDGVSHYGVGRWTDIKRLLFSSSAYRTPVDLRDKWRNLLRASCTQLQSDGEDEQKRKHASRPLPIAVLHRVSELSSIYPYPRERNSKLSRSGHVTSPIPSTSKGTPFSLSRRAIPR
ncbi:hypothetical protein L1049_008484 [Liquidambar formosana]|uniref:Uncharacterized protein n=1 Tax=Liquidambar formosana TaxID=63359 RepID=A0AAP0X5N0_LIQFO